MEDNVNNNKKTIKVMIIICLLLFLFLLLFIIIFNLNKNKKLIKNQRSLTQLNNEKLPSQQNLDSFPKTSYVADLKSNSNNPLGLTIKNSAEYQIDYNSNNPNYMVVIGSSSTTTSNGSHLAINQPIAELLFGPSSTSDTLAKFLEDRNKILSIDDKVITGELLTINGVPAYHQVVQDPAGKIEETYLVIVNGQRILINNRTDNQNTFNNSISTLTFSQQPTITNGVVDVPSIVEPTNSYWQLNKTQKLTTIDDFVTAIPKPTLAVQSILGCAYGPNQPECIPGIPRTCITWVESGTLAAFAAPSGDTILHVWYQDEHALTLGVGSVSQLTRSPDHIINPNTGNPGGVDLEGRPVRPALFITDLTNNSKNRLGDWEYGGNVYEATEIFGTWKALSRNDPHPNGRNLGQGSMTPPASVLDKFVSEIRWDLSNYNLVRGHIYRLEFMVHDGDRNGDAGEKCANFVY